MIMELRPETKLGELLKEYPFLLEFLPTLSPNYEALKNPVLRRTMLNRATLKMIAGRGDMPLEDLITAIEGAIGDAEAPSDEERMEVLKGIIRDLHAGVEMEILRDRFARLCEHVSPTEIAQMEQSLIDEGLAEEEVKRLCDVHVEVFKQSLDTQESPATPAGHPVHNFMAENRATENILDEIDGITGEIGRHPSPETVAAHREALADLVARLSEIEKHYIRKENQLFPRLEAKGMSGPSQVMWAVHDDIRAALKIAREQASSGDPRISLSLEELSITIRDMIYKEENILYPMSLESLTLEDWLMVKEGETEIGFAWIQPLFEWPRDEEIPKEEPAKPVAGSGEPPPQEPPPRLDLRGRGRPGRLLLPRTGEDLSQEPSGNREEGPALPPPLQRPHSRKDSERVQGGEQGRRGFLDHLSGQIPLHQIFRRKRRRGKLQGHPRGQPERDGNQGARGREAAPRLGRLIRSRVWPRARDRCQEWLYP
jgi:hypothetical protein